MFFNKICAKIYVIFYFGVKINGAISTFVAQIADTAVKKNKIFCRYPVRIEIAYV
jgi:hypothetical protein